ncbi:MAG: hypothetical protein FD171_1527 [Actinobacteria bacterium]|nr:MAG: hypothetical protein FD171_1527 [Actinomycetota bacterium]
MARDRVYREWRLQVVLPAELTTLQARDILLDCFHAVHGDYFIEAKSQLGILADERAVMRSVKGAMRLAFKQMHGNYDAPTKHDLENVAEYLAEKSRAWGTPEVVVRRHQSEMERVFSRVADN